ncbi:hypothetical protein [Exiguobacterium mexicanum]|uniref:hypothetical protein n=1 Tax=Exiguobacterium mexicanum TaxID=340146 RepID=UPI00384D96BE
MSKEIYHVVAILNEYSIAIDAGANYGLSQGDKIEIFEEGDSIFNPSTKENLGALVFKKATLEIVHVDEKYSICQKIVTEEPLQSSISLALGNLSKTIGSKKVAAPLDVNTTEIMNVPINLPAEKRVISIGDKARIPF